MSKYAGSFQRHKRRQATTRDGRLIRDRSRTGREKPLISVLLRVSVRRTRNDAIRRTALGLGRKLANPCESSITL